MRISVASLVLATGLAGAYVSSYWPHKGSSVSFVQVGQGDCVLIQEGTFVAVVDTGGQFEGHDSGGRLALPFLRGQGVHKIDLLALTHPDLDHVGGLKAFLRRYRIGRIAMPARFASDLTTQDWLTQCGVSPTQVVWVDRPIDFSVGSLSMRLESTPFGNDTPDNDGSLIARLRYPTSSFLLTGDASETVEDWLVSRGEPPVTVLKAGHHGSRSSTSAGFLASLHPRYVVVSCGRNNHYGHPNPLALRRIAAEGSQVLRTDRDGDITFWLERGLTVTHQMP